MLGKVTAEEFMICIARVVRDPKLFDEYLGLVSEATGSCDDCLDIYERIQVKDREIKKLYDDYQEAEHHREEIETRFIEFVKKHSK